MRAHLRPVARAPQAEASLAMWGGEQVGSIWGPAQQAHGGQLCNTHSPMIGVCGYAWVCMPLTLPQGSSTSNR